MKITKIFALSALLVFLLPSLVFASVKINEIAWMGTTLIPASKGQYCEWVELYNDGNFAVDLAGATLYKDGGQTPIVALTKKIEPGGYYLIERVTNSCPDPVPGFNDDSGSFGGGGLSNLGEYLVLKATVGDPLDSINAAPGWSAGDNSTKQTMQRSGSTWITATGTPRTANMLVNVEADSVASGTTTPSEIGDSDSSIDEVFTGLSAHSSPADLSTKTEDVKIYATAGRNRLALVGAPITFEEKLFNSKSEVIEGGNVSWSYGDGQTGNGKVIVHSYKFPGDYAVVMSVTYSGDTYVARTNVRVVPADLAIVELTPSLVKIFNRSNYEANLGGWSLATDRSTFVIPQDTIVLPKKEITIALEATNIDPTFQEISLVSPSKSVASTFLIKKDEVKNQKPDLISNFPPDHEQTKPVSSPDSEVASVLLGAEQQLLEAKKILGNLPASNREASRAGLVPKYQAIETAEALGDRAPKQIEATSVVVKEEPATTTVLIVEKPRSILKTLLDVPMNAFAYIRSLF